MMSSAWFPQDITELRSNSFGFIRPENLVSRHSSESFRCFFANSKLSCVFYWGEDSVWPCCRNAQIGGVLQVMVVLLEVSPHRISGAQPEWSSGSWSPLLPRPFSPDSCLVPNFFHLSVMETTVLFGTFNTAYIFFAFPRSVPQYNSVSELCWQFLQPNCLVFALICILSCNTLYRQVCLFLLMKNLIYHRWTPIKVLKHLKDVQEKSHLKSFSFLINLQKIPKILFSLFHYKVLSVD